MASVVAYTSAWIETKAQAKKYAGQKQATEAMVNAGHEKYEHPVTTPPDKHPGYPDHIKKCRENFAKYVATQMKNDKDKTVLFGDSISAQARDRIGYAVNPLLNNALGGMSFEHMEQCFDDMVQFYDSVGFIPKTIVVGTGGNNYLAYFQEANYGAAQGKKLLDKIRLKYSPLTTRIVILGLPMTIVPYVIQCKSVLDGMSLNWINTDVNAVGLPLIKHFVATNHILPKNDMNSDGVHMTPLGQLLLGDLIVQAKTGKARRLINNG